MFELVDCSPGGKSYNPADNQTNIDIADKQPDWYRWYKIFWHLKLPDLYDVPALPTLSTPK